LAQVLAENLNNEIEKLKKQRVRELREKFNVRTQGGFWEFCKYLYPNFFKDEKTELARCAEILHNSARYSVLKDESLSRYRKIMINIYPRFGKSFLTSVYSLWLLAQYPKGTIMRNACDATLAEKFSRDVRNMIENDNDESESLSTVQGKVQAIYPNLGLSRDKRSLNMWALKSAKDVSYYCAGVGGRITGSGCDLAMILDDPVKDPEKALSESFNNDLVDWYLTVHRSRRDRDSDVQGSEIIIMARWSDTDLCGQLLEAESDWLQFQFDAEDENGNSSCEAILSTRDLHELKAGFINTGRLKWWNALYRQQTADVSKKLFPKKDLKRFSLGDLDFGNRELFDTVGWCDVADKGTDDLCAPVAYFCKATGDLYIFDVVFSAEPSEITVGLVANNIVGNGIQQMTFESNNGGRWYAQLVQQSLADIGHYECGISDQHSASNKETKILVGSSLVMSKCHFLCDEDIAIGSQYFKYLNALCGYQKERRNAHDDAADATTSLAMNFAERGGFSIF